MTIPLVRQKWYYAERLLPFWIKKDPMYEEYDLPFIKVIADEHSGKILDAQLVPGEETKIKRLNYLLKLMLNPLSNSGIEPYRPYIIHFEKKAMADQMRPMLEPFGIEAFHHPQPQLVDAFVTDFTEHYLSEGPLPPPSILTGKGVTPIIAGRFYEAAAAFYEAEPWIYLANEDVLKIQVGSKEIPRFVIVMGQAGLSYGLAPYETWEELLFFYGESEPTEITNPRGRHVLMYEEPPVVSVDDLENAKKYNWKIPDRDHFPLPLLLLPEKFNIPDATMLIWYEAVLKAIPIFIEEDLVTEEDGSHPPVEATLEVETLKGKVEVRITYPGGDLSQLVPSKKKLTEDGSSAEKEDSPLGEPLDRRLIESDMAGFTEMIEGFEPITSSAARQTQELIYDAWEERNPEKRLRMARKALQIYPDCADAYVLLAEEEAITYEEELKYYQAGVDAGRRALGEKFFTDEKNKGMFWGCLETRPFMRALAGLGTTLWNLQRKEEAEKNYRYMLELNPNDNQGIRYTLMALLFEMGKFKEARKLLKDNPWDSSTEWIYSRVLLGYKLSGPTAKVERDLQEALDANPYVPDYLCGFLKLPAKDMQMLSMGSEEEAIYYSRTYLNHWRRTPGAVNWLKSKP